MKFIKQKMHNNLIKKKHFEKKKYNILKNGILFLSIIKEQIFENIFYKIFKNL